MASIDYAHFRSFESLMLQDDDFLDDIYTYFTKSHLFSDLKYFGILNKKRKLFSGFNDLKSEIKKLKFNSYIFSNALNDIDDETVIELDLEDSYVNIRLILYVPFNELEHYALLMKEVMLLFFNRFKSIFDFDLVATICLPDQEFPQTRPPRLWRKFNPTGLIDFVNPDKADSEDIENLIKEIADGELPAGVKKEQLNSNLILLDWIGVEEAGGDFSKVVFFRCKWIYNHSNFLLRSNYNLLGDRMIDIVGKIKTPHFTFYSAFDNSAYQALVPDYNGDNFNRERLGIFVKWLEYGHSPDGLKVEKINLIFPTRADAINYKPVVDQLRNIRLLYTDNEGKLWDPFPPGIWLD